MGDRARRRVVLGYVLLLGAMLAMGGCAAGSSVPGSPAGTPTSEFVLAAYGDSITADPGETCPGCTAWVDRYAEALTSATGTPVDVRNHGRPSLRVEALLQDLASGSSAEDAAAADAVVVGVGTSDAPWSITDDACDGPATRIDFVRWELYTDDCVAAEVARFRPTFDAVFRRIAALRAGEPTLLRTINQYNDWIGFDGVVPPEAIEASVTYVGAWNAMICETAEANGFACGDVGHAFNGTDGRTASGDLLAPDYIHPSDKGYERISNVLVELGFAPLVDAQP